MLRSTNAIRGEIISATDGEIGKVDDLLFDINQWGLRYFVVNTGTWLPGRKVLISPAACSRPDWLRLPVRLTREEVSNSPDISSVEDFTLSRESDLVKHFGWPIYWAGSANAGASRVPEAPPAQDGSGPETQRYLQGERGAKGFSVEAVDGKIGHIDDMIMDDEAWMMRYFVVDTANLLNGKSVLVAVGWTDTFNMREKTLSLTMTKEDLARSPEYDPLAPVNRQYEARLYDFYGQPRYWSR